MFGINNALYGIRSLSGMVVPSSREVMTCGVETMVIGSYPLWVPVRPSVKRATPQSKNALWIRTTVNTTLIGTVFRVLWYTSAIQESVYNTLRSHSDGSILIRWKHINILIIASITFVFFI